MTEWARSVALYDALVTLSASSIVELNRAAAGGMAYGPAAALEIIDGIRHEPALRGYHPC